MVTPVLAAVAAVLGSREVVMVQVAPLAVVSRAALPAEGIAIFAAPDGRLVVPLAGLDATAIVQPDGTLRQWPGRLFPLFFDEVDRMYALVPGLITTLAYPERVEIERAPVDGLGGVWRAACSRDGRLVAIIPAAGERRELIFAEPRPGGAVVRAGLTGTGEFVVVAPDAAWAIVATAEGGLELVAPTGPAWHGRVAAAGELSALSLSEGGDDLLVGMKHADGGLLVGFRVEPGKPEPLRRKFSTPIDQPPVGVATAGADVLVTTSSGVVWLVRGGRKLGGSLALAGARGLAIVPDVPRSVAPAWSDTKAPR